MISRLLARFSRKRPVRYDDHFFDQAWFDNWKTLGPVLAQLVGLVTDQKRILDFGAGPGCMIDLMNDRGYDYVGCDNSIEAKQLYEQHFGKYPEKYWTNLEKSKSASFDLFLSFDVFEHMTDDQIAHVMATINKIPLFFLNISRSRAISGHINIKNDRKWIRFFQEQGLRFDQSTTNSVRQRYTELKPDLSELWHKNIFVLRRE